MKVSIVSFGPNPRVVAKFQTDRFRTFGENRGEKKNKNKTFGRLVNHIRSAAATLRSAVAGGVNYYITLIMTICYDIGLVVILILFKCQNSYNFPSKISNVFIGTFRLAMTFMMTLMLMAVAVGNPGVHALHLSDDVLRENAAERDNETAVWVAITSNDVLVHEVGDFVYGTAAQQVGHAD